MGSAIKSRIRGSRMEEQYDPMDYFRDEYLELESDRWLRYVASQPDMQAYIRQMGKLIDKHGRGSRFDAYHAVLLDASGVDRDPRCEDFITEGLPVELLDNERLDLYYQRRTLQAKYARMRSRWAYGGERMACPYCRSESWRALTGYQSAWTNGTRLFGSLTAECLICERPFLVVRVMDSAFWEEHYPEPRTRNEWDSVIEDLSARFRGIVMDFQRKLDRDFAKAVAATRRQRVRAATVLGVDPGNGCLRGLAVVKDDGSLYLLDVYWMDDEMRFEPVDGPIESRQEAVRMMREERERLLGYTWFIPGTEEPVPGCWTSYRQSGGVKDSERRTETRTETTNRVAEA